jgi:small-conductance mechanosensitive channel
MPVFYGTEIASALMLGTAQYPAPSDLAEAWTRAQLGFSFGGVTLSPFAILTCLVVFIIGYSLTGFVQGAMRSSILPKTKLDPGGQNAVSSIIGYVGIALSALLAITSAGINLSSLAVVAGALSVGIGFGMQQVVSNFVSGIILLVERPVAVGDWIEVSGQQGIVKKMAVRATQIRTFDRNDIIIPNSNLITQPVTNWTRGSLQGRIIIPLTVSVTADSREVARLMIEIAEDQPTIMVNPAPVAFLRTITSTGLTFELRAVVADINGGTAVVSEINHQILKRFAEAGISLPGSTRASQDVYLYKTAEAPAPAAGEDGGDADQPATVPSQTDLPSHVSRDFGPAAGQDGRA